MITNLPTNIEEIPKDEVIDISFLNTETLKESILNSLKDNELHVPTFEDSVELYKRNIKSMMSAFKTTLIETDIFGVVNSFDKCTQTLNQTAQNIVVSGQDITATLCKQAGVSVSNLSDAITTLEEAGTSLALEMKEIINESNDITNDVLSSISDITEFTNNLTSALPVTKSNNKILVIIVSIIIAVLVLTICYFLFFKGGKNE